MVVERCRFIIMLMVRYVITMVIGDVTKGFARMRYGLVVDCRRRTNTFRAGVCLSSPKLSKAHQSHTKSLHRREQVSKRCLNQRAV